jgi:hypothetical protein
MNFNCLVVLQKYNFRPKEKPKTTLFFHGFFFVIGNINELIRPLALDSASFSDA